MWCLVTLDTLCCLKNGIVGFGVCGCFDCWLFFTLPLREKPFADVNLQISVM